MGRYEELWKSLKDTSEQRRISKLHEEQVNEAKTADYMHMVDKYHGDKNLSDAEKKWLASLFAKGHMPTGYRNGYAWGHDINGHNKDWEMKNYEKSSDEEQSSEKPFLSKKTVEELIGEKLPDDWKDNLQYWADKVDEVVTKALDSADEQQVNEAYSEKLKDKARKVYSKAKPNSPQFYVAGDVLYDLTRDGSTVKGVDQIGEYHRPSVGTLDDRVRQEQEKSGRYRKSDRKTSEKKQVAKSIDRHNAKEDPEYSKERSRGADDKEFRGKNKKNGFSYKAATERDKERDRRLKSKNEEFNAFARYCQQINESDDTLNKYKVEYVNSADKSASTEVIASSEREAKRIAKQELGREIYRIINVKQIG